MEIIYSFILFFTFLFLLKRYQPKATNQGPKLPPGPWQLPIIGSMHQLLGGSCLHHKLANLAKAYGPLIHLRLGEVSTIIVSSPEAAREVMKTHDLSFVDRPVSAVMKVVTHGGKDIGFSQYGEYWRQMKKVCILELLASKRVHSFRSIREQEASDLMHAIRMTNSSLFDLSEKLRSLNNNVISRATFGSRCKDKDALLSVLREVAELLLGFNLADFFPSWKSIGMISGMQSKSERFGQKIDCILDSIINTVRGENCDALEEGMVNVLLRLQEEGSLELPVTADEVKGIMFGIFLAGSRTSSALMEWTMSELMRHPRVMEKVQAEVRHALHGKERVTEDDLNELNYLKLVIKEALRLHPPAPLLIPRTCREECNVLGYSIPKGTRVVVNAWALGRDPKYWEDAESFKPERFDGSPIGYKGSHFEFIPFGAGRRSCPGISFALASTELVLAQLLYYFDWKLPNGMGPDDVDMSENVGSGSGRRNGLCLSAIPCIPLPLS